MGYGSGGSSLGVPCWLDYGTIYGLTWQTISFEADDGACVYVFNGQSTTPIPFDATAEDWQAAFEPLSSVGAGKVTASGEPGNIHLEFDRSIIPTLITVGENTLEIEASPVEPAVFITDGNLEAAIYTPSEGDIVVDVLSQTVEAFTAVSKAAITGEGEDKTFISTAPLLTVGAYTGGYREPDSDTHFPFVSTGQPLSLVLVGVGGEEMVTGSLRLWLCVASPAPLPSN